MNYICCITLITFVILDLLQANNNWPSLCCICHIRLLLLWSLWLWFQEENIHNEWVTLPKEPLSGFLGQIESSKSLPSPEAVLARTWIAWWSHTPCTVGTAPWRCPSLPASSYNYTATWAWLEGVPSSCPASVGPASLTRDSVSSVALSGEFSILLAREAGFRLRG